VSQKKSYEELEAELRELKQPRRFIGSVGESTYTALLVTVVFLLWALTLVAACLVIGVMAAILWKAVSFALSSSAYSTIFKNAEATATLVGVVVAGLFGFGGIILTNFLSARAARKQAEESATQSRAERRENARLARELQVQIAEGLDRRIQGFSDAFAKYHAETLAALRRK
jgi:hypothetical protein